jgi:hypothetical protein
MIATVLILLAQTEPAPVVIAHGKIQAPRQPQVAVSANGNVHLTFGDGDRIYYARSNEASPLKFGEPVLVAETPNLALGMRRGPRVAVAGNTVVISAISGLKGRGRDENLLAWRSTDDGASWEGPATVNDAPAAAREGLHAMAAGPNGFVCAWIDLRTKQSDIRVSTSPDGVTWSPNAIAYQSPSGRVCECCQPSLGFDERGTLHLLWRNSLDGLRDIYRAVSEDGGKTFGPAVKLGSGSWTLNACPMDGGGIAVHRGKVATAWRRERIVYATFGSDEKEVRLGDGEQPCIASNANETIVVWLKRRPGDLMVRREKDAAPTLLARAAADPVAVSTADGHVLLAWEGKAEGKPAIFVHSLGAKGGQ